MPDFSLKIKWEFSTWIPLVDLLQLLPSDVYYIHKMGTSVRIDFTLKKIGTPFQEK